MDLPVVSVKQISPASGLQSSLVQKLQALRRLHRRADEVQRTHSHVPYEDSNSRASYVCNLLPFLVDTFIILSLSSKLDLTSF